MQVIEVTLKTRQLKHLVHVVLWQRCVGFTGDQNDSWAFILFVKLNFKKSISLNISKIIDGELYDDPGVMLIGILYIAMNLLHTILHCQTPSLCLSLVLLW